MYRILTFQKDWMHKMVFKFYFKACCTVNLTNKPFDYQPHKMFRHTHVICQVLATNCLNVLNHFVGLVLKRLSDV